MTGDFPPRLVELLNPPAGVVALAATHIVTCSNGTLVMAVLTRGGPVAWEAMDIIAEVASALTRL